MFVDISHHMPIAVGIFDRWRIGILFEIAVEDDLVPFLIGIDEVQDKGRVRFKPADIFRLAITWNERETRWQPFVQPRHMDIALQQLLIPEQRKVAQY